ncbi:MAG TPA: hypothetical protein PKM48_09500, partial [Parvularculaceae bacterium]|nr:hypothetical protein [Parvularculaceae bacterium]
VAASLLLTIGWEFYWRGRDYVAGDFKNTPGLWLQERRKAKADATVLIGSSRIFFDANLDVWEETAGVRPIQLALEGTSPEAFLADLADDEDFNGTVIVGVTSGLMFSGFMYRKEVLDYARKESLSQRADHLLSLQLEKIFAFIDEQTRPKTIIRYAVFPLREGMPQRYDVPKLDNLAIDRNAHVWPYVAEHPEYAENHKNSWRDEMRFLSSPGPDGSVPGVIPDEKVSEIIGNVKANIDKIRARGGDVAFVRFPYEGDYRPFEDEFFPRERFWDRLVAETDSAGVFWLDHPELQGYFLPEWSHIEAEDAKRFTRNLTPILYAKMEKKKAERAARKS